MRCQGYVTINDHDIYQPITVVGHVQLRSRI